MDRTLRDTASERAASRPRQTRQNGPAIAAFRALVVGDSQNVFAKKLGLGQSSLSEIESEVVSARMPTLIVIAQALGVPVGAILRNRAEPVPSLVADGNAA